MQQNKTNSKLEVFVKWSAYTATLYAPLAAASAAIVAQFGNVPTHELITSAAVSFGAVGLGINQISSWRERKTIRGKLAFSNILVDVATNKENTKTLIKLGFSLQNLSDKEIFFFVEEIHTEAMGHINPDRKHKPKNILISPGGEGFWRDDPIVIEKPTPISGKMIVTFKISYWNEAENRKFNLQKSLEVMCNIDPENNSMGTWQER